MEEMTRIQEEFESLISELENLKKVNQLTSENTQNTKKVISEIDSFVNSINAFKSLVIEDYETKRSDFEKALDLLDSSFKGIDDNTSQQSEKLTKLLNDTKESVNHEIGDLKVKMKNATDEYIDSLIQVNSSIQKSIELFTQSTAESIEAREANLVSKTKSIEDKIDLLTNDLKKAKVENELSISQISNSLDQKIRSLNSKIETELEAIKLSHSEDLETLKNKLEEQQKLASDLMSAEVVKNREEIRISRVIFIVLMIILFGAMIYLAIK